MNMRAEHREIAKTVLRFLMGFNRAYLYECEFSSSLFLKKKKYRKKLHIESDLKLTSFKLDANGLIDKYQQQKHY